MSSSKRYIVAVFIFLGALCAGLFIWYRYAAYSQDVPSNTDTYTAVDISRYLGTSMPHEVSTVNDFHSLMANTQLPLVVKFYATWCNVCESMKPIDTAIAQEFSSKVALVMVDVDNSSFEDIFSKFMVASVPTYLLVNKGKVTGRINGALSLDEYRSIVTSLVSSS